MPKKADSPVVKARRIKLRKWIDDHFDGVPLRFAKSIGMSQPQVADMLDGRKSFGEKAAAGLEKRAKMPPKYLVDPDGSAVEPGKMKAWSLHLSEEEAEVGVEWGKLDEPDKAVIRDKIYARVATQMRAKYGSRKPKPPRPPTN